MLLLGLGDFARWVSMETDHREEDAARHRSRRHEAVTRAVSAPVPASRPGLDPAPQLVDFDQQTTVQLLGAHRRDGLRPRRVDAPADTARVLPDSLDGLVDGVAHSC